MLACSAMVGCTSEDVPEVNNGENKFDGEKAYLAVKIASTNANSRAEGGAYEKGEAKEHHVSDARFYFFDANYNAFNIGGTNYKEATPGNTNTDDMNKVEEILETVLVIDNYQGTLPKYIVAVLNTANKLGSTSLSLTDLKDQVGDFATYGMVGASQKYTDNKGASQSGDFVMSSSVYADANGAETIAVPLSAENFKTTSDEAQNAAVKIYVERVAAKVRVSNFGTNGTTTFDVYATDENGNVTNNVYKFGEKTVKAKILGYQVVDYSTHSYLIKDIDPAWTDADLGFAWNDAPWFRSYWAVTTPIAESANQIEDPNYSYDNIKANTAARYCFENTLGTTPTQVIVAAQLQDAEGEPMEIAEWMGYKYTKTALKEAMLSTLTSKLYTLETETTGEGEAAVTTKKWTSIESTDYIDFKKANDSGAKDYEAEAIFVMPVGQEYGKDINFYAKGSETPLEKADVEAIFEAIEPAMVWNNGMTYYNATITHLGTAGKSGEIGVVRNHIYDLGINKIAGLGTPVVEGDAAINKTEVVSEKSFVAATINIHSWRLVNNNSVVLK